MNIRSLHDTLTRKSPFELAQERSAMIEAMEQVTQRTADSNQFSNFLFMLDPAAAILPGEQEKVKRFESSFAPLLRDNVVALHNQNLRKRA
jgi:hypothetical protein